MIDSISNAYSLPLFRRVLERAASVNKADEKSAVSALDTDSVHLSTSTHPHTIVLQELQVFQTALKAYRDSGDIEPLKDYYEESKNPALDPLFAMEKGTEQANKVEVEKDDKIDTLSVLERLEQTSTKSFDSIAQKMDALAKRMENLYQVVSIVYRLTDYDGLENYVKQATDILDKASGLLGKAQAAIESMPDGPEKEAARQNLAGLKSSLKRMVGQAEKIKEKAQALTVGMKDKPDSYKAFEKAINKAKPLTLTMPQPPSNTKSDT